MPGERTIADRAVESPKERSPEMPSIRWRHAAGRDGVEIDVVRRHRCNILISKMTLVALGCADVTCQQQVAVRPFFITLCSVVGRLRRPIRLLSSHASGSENRRNGPATILMTSVRAHIRPTDDHHRVTTLELLFDLVFVFAITNIAGAIEMGITGGDAARSMLEGVIVLALVWFGWCSYAWLGATVKADEGLTRVAMIVAMTGMFFVAISIPHAFAVYGNTGAVLAGAFSVVRLVQLLVSLVAADGDKQAHGVLRGMLFVVIVVIVLLLIGAAVGGVAQLWLWSAAVVADQLGVYLVRSTRWRPPSASHFAERFGLVIIIAIGESIVELGTASSRAELTGRVSIALLCGVAVAVCLWWLYFDVVALVAATKLRESRGVQRARVARDTYTYLHFPMLTGIVFTAVGLALLVAEKDIDDARAALYGGIALYLASHAAFGMREHGRSSVPSILTMAGLLIALPLGARLPSLTQLLLPAVALTALVTVEVRLLGNGREQVRHGSEPSEHDSVQ